MEHEPGANPGTAGLGIWILQGVERAQWQPARRTTAAAAEDRASKGVVAGRTRYLPEEEMTSLFAAPARPRGPSEARLPPDELHIEMKTTRSPKRTLEVTGENALPRGERGIETPSTMPTNWTTPAAVAAVLAVRGRPRVVVRLRRGTSRSGSERSVAKSAGSAGGTRNTAPTVTATVIESVSESETAIATVTVSGNATDPGIVVAPPVLCLLALPPPPRLPPLPALLPLLLLPRSEKGSAKSAVLRVLNVVRARARRGITRTAVMATTLPLLLPSLPGVLRQGRGGRGTRQRWIIVKRTRRGARLVGEGEGVGGVVAARGDWERVNVPPLFWAHHDITPLLV